MILIHICRYLYFLCLDKLKCLAPKLTDNVSILFFLREFMLLSYFTLQFQYTTPATCDITASSSSKVTLDSLLSVLKMS